MSHFDMMRLQKYFAVCGVQPFKVVYEDFVQAYEEKALQILDYLYIPIPSLERVQADLRLPRI
jgi:hypothetical protein